MMWEQDFKYKRVVTITNGISAMSHRIVEFPVLRLGPRRSERHDVKYRAGFAYPRVITAITNNK